MAATVGETAARILSVISPPSELPVWFDKIPWLSCFLTFMYLVEIFEQHLNCRQLKCYDKEEVPEELQCMVSREELKKATLYNKDKLQFSMLASAVRLIFTTYFFIFFVYPTLWRLAGELAGSYSNEYTKSLLFCGLNIPLALAESTCFGLYKDFVIEERHGFNKKTLNLFLSDTVKSLAVSTVIGAPILCMIICLIRWAANSFFIYVWVFLMVVTFFLMTIYPNFIAPLFNKFEALHDAELKSKIEELAKSLNFPLTKLYQMDGSTRSTHSNAYMYGVWNNKRIVLYDTLLKLPHNQILAILSHELGHWKLRHTITNMLLAFLQMFLMLWVFELVVWNESLYLSFGFPAEFQKRPVTIGLFLFSSVYTPVSTVIGLLMTLLSRRHEFQADQFAFRLGHGAALKDALMELSKQNLSEVDSDEWYAWYHFSHPPLAERLRALNKEEEMIKKAD